MKINFKKKKDSDNALKVFIRNLSSILLPTTEKFWTQLVFVTKREKEI